MNREEQLTKAFAELKASTVDAAACIQNDCPNNVLLLQLIDSQRRVNEAYNVAWKAIVNLVEE